MFVQTGFMFIPLFTLILPRDSPTVSLNSKWATVWKRACKCSHFPFHPPLLSLLLSFKFTSIIIGLMAHSSMLVPSKKSFDTLTTLFPRVPKSLSAAKPSLVHASSFLQFSPTSLATPPSTLKKPSDRSQHSPNSRPRKKLSKRLIRLMLD